MSGILSGAVLPCHFRQPPQSFAPKPGGQEGPPHFPYPGDRFRAWPLPEITEVSKRTSSRSLPISPGHVFLEQTTARKKFLGLSCPGRQSASDLCIVRTTGPLSSLPSTWFGPAWTLTGGAPCR